MYAEMFTPATNNQAEQARKKKKGEVRSSVESSGSGTVVKREFSGGEKTETSYDASGKRKGMQKIKAKY